MTDRNTTETLKDYVEAAKDKPREIRTVYLTKDEITEIQTKMAEWDTMMIRLEYKPGDLWHYIEIIDHYQETNRYEIPVSDNDASSF